MKGLILLIFVYFTGNFAHSQNETGQVLCKDTREPISYVNIGIPGQGVGTVSDINGRFQIKLDDLHSLDTLVFSCIGFSSEKILVKDFQNMNQPLISMQKAIIELEEVIVRSGALSSRILGNTTRSKAVKAGFKENQLGYEMGVLMKVKRAVYPEKINIHIAETSYDTLYYRLNIYSHENKNDFRNILASPIYITIPSESIEEPIVIDLREHNLRMENDFLVTLEHIKDMGPGYLNFNAGFRGRTYHRKTSHAHWESTPIGIGINVVVLEEKK